MASGFQNKIDAKKPDSRKNQAFLELLARFELATSSLPTALEYKERYVPAFSRCFLQGKVPVLIFFATLLSIPIYTSWVKLWVRILRVFLRMRWSAASHDREPLRIVASREGKVKPSGIYFCTA